METDNKTVEIERAYQLYLEGREAMDRGDYDGAVANFSASVLLEPHFKTLELLGESYVKLGQLKEAVVPLAAATTLNKQVRAPALLCGVLAQLDDKDLAMRICEVALQRDPKNRIALELREQLSIRTDPIQPD